MKQDVVVDSNILYRLNGNIDTLPWQKTSRFLLLKNLKSNKEYQLEVKYAGSDLTNVYTLKTLPQWFQKPGLIIVLVFIVLMLSVITIFLILRHKWRQERKKRREISFQIKALQNQLNPHFIFNALSSIQALINSDRKEEANGYLKKFATVLRYALQNSESIFVPFVSEIELLKNYLNLEKFRFNFNYEIQIDEALNLNELEVPPLLFQPAVENAIRHGITGKEGSGIIKITVKKEGTGFIVIVADNGSWKLPMAGAKGLGIDLIKKRILAINELSNIRKIKFSVSGSEAGTIVNFDFENWLI